MKKILLFVFIIFAFFSCSRQKDTKKLITVVMVNDMGSIYDSSFTQNAWSGVVKYAKDKNLPRKNYVHINSPTPNDYIPNISNFADMKFDLIVTPGYYFLDSINVVAQKYPKQKILLIDAISKLNENVSSVTFNSNEGSFLVGVCAALKANEMKLNKVGFLGGIDIKEVNDFEAGFIAGVKSINPNINIVVEYANDFANPSKGQKIAAKMYDKGINIIFNVAGFTGSGLIKEARIRAQRGEKVWVIGVDKDQYKEGIYMKDKSVILTSMMKRLDVVTYDTMLLVETGKFKGGHKIYSLKNDGVGIPKNNPNLKSQWLKIVKKYKDDIINKKIIVPNVPDRIKSK